MNIDLYVQERTAREPRFGNEVAAARSELDLATALVQWRHNREMTLGQIAEITGMSEERIEAIEEGDAITVSEIMWLAQALNLVVSIGPNFNVTISSTVPSVRYSKHPDSSQVNQTSGVRVQPPSGRLPQPAIDTAPVGQGLAHASRS